MKRKAVGGGNSMKLLFFIFGVATLAALFFQIDHLQNLQDCIGTSIRTVKSNSNTIILSKAISHDSAFHDACQSNYATGMSKRMVEARATDISFNMFVYGFEGGIMDIVSRVVARDKVWEKPETEEMMSLFPCILGEECKKDGSFTNRHGTLLDVGANIGWYSIVAAHLGHNGAFEENGVLLLKDSALILLLFLQLFLLNHSAKMLTLFVPQKNNFKRKRKRTGNFSNLDST
jgi:hypothetical protein